MKTKVEKSKNSKLIKIKISRFPYNGRKYIFLFYKKELIKLIKQIKDVINHG